jgi:hypothetical protein
MRLLIMFLAAFLLTACNEVTGNERGGMIAGVPNNFGLSFEGLWMTNADALGKVNMHCRQFGKVGRITSISFGKTLFECS